MKGKLSILKLFSRYSKAHQFSYSVSRVDSAIMRRSFSFSPSRVLSLILTNIPNASKNSMLSCNIRWIGVLIMRFNIVPRSANTKTIAAHAFMIIAPLFVFVIRSDCGSCSPCLFS